MERPTTFNTLKEADNGTKIVCLTPSVNYNQPSVVRTDICRCYFQVKGVVKEVGFFNRTWSIVGDVPI